MESSALPHQHAPPKVYKATPVFSIDKDVRINVAPDVLGEGPVWDHRYERLYWIDILGRCLSIYDVGTNRVSRIGLKSDMPGFAVPTSKKHLLMCGSQNGIFTLSVENAHITRMTHPERNRPANRFNDGKVDPAGRLFAGTMQMKEKASDVREKGSARLYCLSGGHHHLYTSPSVVNQVGKVTVSNGLGWSPEGDKFYYVDTPTQQIEAYEYDAKTGELSHRRVVYEMPPNEGSPDGLAVDADGFIWVAALKAGQVRRIDPVDGIVVAIVEVPTPLVTSVCFGGPYLSTLYITTARGTSMDQAQACTDDGAGLLYSVDVGVSGLPMTPFRLDHSKL